MSIRTVGLGPCPYSTLESLVHQGPWNQLPLARVSYVTFQLAKYFVLGSKETLSLSRNVVLALPWRPRSTKDPRSFGHFASVSLSITEGLRHKLPVPPYLGSILFVDSLTCLNPLFFDHFNFSFLFQQSELHLHCDDPHAQILHRSCIFLLQYVQSMLFLLRLFSLKKSFSGGCRSLSLFGQ